MNKNKNNKQKNTQDTDPQTTVRNAFVSTAYDAMLEAISNNDPTAKIEIGYDYEEGLGFEWGWCRGSHLLTLGVEYNYCLSKIIRGFDKEDCGVWAEEMGVLESFEAILKGDSDVEYALRAAIEKSDKGAEFATAWFKSGDIDSLGVRELAHTLEEAVEDLFKKDLLNEEEEIGL